MGSGAVLTADSLTALFERHAGALFGYCARRVGPDTAEDIVAGTFLVAYERRSRYDPDRAEALPWLYGIATNLLRRHRRDELRAYRALSRTGLDPLAADGDRDGGAQRAAERADTAKQARRIAGVLLALPARQREVLLLFAVGQLEYAEIAQALGIPLGSVQSALHRARTKLRAALSEGVS
jgi:RNA polymerase sigma-70 factor (ECF subfamily)